MFCGRCFSLELLFISPAYNSHLHFEKPYIFEETKLLLKGSRSASQIGEPLTSIVSRSDLLACISWAPIQIIVCFPCIVVLFLIDACPAAISTCYISFLQGFQKPDPHCQLIIGPLLRRGCCRERYMVVIHLPCFFPLFSCILLSKM